MEINQHQLCLWKEGERQGEGRLRSTAVLDVTQPYAEGMTDISVMYIYVVYMLGKSSALCGREGELE